MQIAETTLEDCRGSEKESPDSPEKTKDEFQGNHDIDSSHGAAITPKIETEPPPHHDNQAPPGYAAPQTYDVPVQGMNQQPAPGPAPGNQPPPEYAAPQTYGMPDQGMNQQPAPGPAPGNHPPPGYAAPQSYGMPDQGMSQQPHPGYSPGNQPPPRYAAPQSYGMPIQEMNQQPHPGYVPGNQPPPGYAAPQSYGMPVQGMNQQPHPGYTPGNQPPPGYAAPQSYGMPMPGQPDQSASGHSCKCNGNPNAEDANLKHDLNRYGQLLDAVTGIMNGEPDIPKIAGILDSYDPAFWKGAIIGVLSSLILTNDTVKGAITGTISKALGKEA